MTRLALHGPAVFDGEEFLADHAVLIEDGRVAGLAPVTAVPAGWPTRHVPVAVISPGLVDLQVNGGGGAMVDGSTDVEGFRRLCACHAALGATSILPTLITDTPEATAHVIAAGIAAADAGVPGFLGLHLEGPHLDRRRAGAHDPSLIRPMTDGDVAALCMAARRLPSLMVTVAPASVTAAQIAALAAAGVVVSLGHADCTLAEAQAAIQAGARCVTHLFNAMSPLGSREPGLVGAALGSALAVGLIADGHHVHPETMRLALLAKRAGSVFIVSDAMAVAGTAADGFTLGARRVSRHDGRLVLDDGTLAGADLTMAAAVRVLVDQVRLEPAQALAMATSRPAAVIGAAAGQLRPGAPADLALWTADWRIAEVWRAGAPLRA